MQWKITIICSFKINLVKIIGGPIYPTNSFYLHFLANFWKKVKKNYAILK